MHAITDVIALGVHDSKNALFDALTRVNIVRDRLAAGDTAAADSAALLATASAAIAHSVDRMSMLLSAYRLMRHENPIVLMPVPLAELLEYACIRARSEWAGAASLETRLAGDCLWLLDRELIADCLVNALVNASRYAKARVTLSAQVQDERLLLTVEDDGPGFPPEVLEGQTGPGSVGLFIADRVVQLHVRNGIAGRLTLANRADNAGALFCLALP